MNNQYITILGNLSSDKDIKINTNNTFNFSNNVLINKVKINDNISNSKLITLGQLDSLTVNGDSNVNTLTIDTLSCNTLQAYKIKNAQYKSFSSSNLYIDTGRINKININLSHINNLKSVNNTATIRNLILSSTNSSIRIDNCNITNPIKVNSIPFTNDISIMNNMTVSDLYTVSSLLTTNASIHNLNNIYSKYRSLFIKDSINTNSFFSQDSTISSLNTINGNIKASLNILNTHVTDNLYTDNIGIINQLLVDNLSTGSLYTNNIGTINNLYSNSINITSQPNNNSLQFINNNNNIWSLFNGSVNNDSFLGIGYNMNSSTYTTAALSTNPLLNTSSIILTNNNVISTTENIIFNTNNFKTINIYSPNLTINSSLNNLPTNIELNTDKLSDDNTYLIFLYSTNNNPKLYCSLYIYYNKNLRPLYVDVSVSHNITIIDNIIWTIPNNVDINNIKVYAHRII
jgi:hypothetical protein